MDEVRERFLRAIVERIPLERIIEVHVFAPMRQGILESGVAVVAAERESPVAPEQEGQELQELQDEQTAMEGELAPVAEVEPEPAPEPESAPPEGPTRHEIFSARYRLVRKGPDRGKWECEIVSQADAPLPTVDAVVRGVNERANDALGAERIDVAALRELLGAPAWTATTA